jgi:hypothetical protein
MPRPVESNSSEGTGLGGLFLRLFWMGGGNFGLLALAILITQKRILPYRLTDLLFWVIVILLIVARYVDIAYFEGATSYGEPATMKHWRRYAIGLGLISLVVWAVAHGIDYLP